MGIHPAKVIKHNNSDITRGNTMRFAGALVLVVAICCGTEAYKTYAGYQVLETSVLDETGVKKLSPLVQRAGLDFWTEPRVGGRAQVMASPAELPALFRSLHMMNLQPHVLVPDVGVLVEEERAQIRRAKRSNNRAPAFDRFLTYDEIQAYIDEVAAAFPSIVSVITIGTSYEGRVMRVLKISNGPGKQAIWFDAAIHAREWAAPPVALKIIYELTENLAANQAMLDANDFYILPVANPDGYSYTWSDERFWRKTRQPNAGSSCTGSDANRNYDLQWGGGGIPSECSETFPGSAPYSEPETRAMSDFILNTTDITFCVALHSHGQLILSPWSWTSDLPQHYDEMMRVGNEAAVALEAVRGTTYEVGTSASLLYYSYGNSKDWAYGGAGVNFSYTVELPSGGSGFDPSPSDILPVVTETWEAIKVFAANIPASRHPPEFPKHA